ARGAVQDHPYRRLIERVRTLYRRNDLGGPLPFGQVDWLALPYESYKMAFTPGLLAEIYGSKMTTAQLTTVLRDEGRYQDLDSDGAWWMPSGRLFFSPNPASPDPGFARNHFYLPQGAQDPFGSISRVAYDASALLMIRTEDALGNTVTAENDYRVMQPRLVTDPNGNRAAAAFDSLGMVAGTAVMGKTTESLGDSLIGFTADLAPQQIDDFFASTDPHSAAAALLGNATTRIIYDLDRFHSSRKANPEDATRWAPVFASTVARETHVSDLQPNQQSKLQISFSYSNGFGREIQKKIQAEPETPGGPLRWVGSGWTIFNNKGKPVRQYEPFFSGLPGRRHQFEFGNRVGASPILFYDPVERVVATLHPNRTWEKVVFDPWRQETWDVNDTVLQVDP